MHYWLNIVPPSLACLASPAKQRLPLAIANPFSLVSHTGCLSLHMRRCLSLCDLACRYDVTDGYYPQSPTSNSSAPAAWYGMLATPLGAPLGPAVRVPGAGSGWVMQRQFAHAKVVVDLADYAKGRVIFG